MVIETTAVFNPSSTYYRTKNNNKVGKALSIANQAELDALLMDEGDLFEEVVTTPTNTNRSSGIPRKAISKADALALSAANRQNSLALPQAIADLPLGTVVTGKCEGFAEKLSRNTAAMYPVCKVNINGAKFLILFNESMEEGGEFQARIDDATGITRSNKTLTIL